MTIDKGLKTTLAGALAAWAMAGAVHAEDRRFDIPASDLRVALDAYARQSHQQIIYRTEDLQGARSPGARGALSDDAALARILAGTPFDVRRDASGALAVVRRPQPPPTDASSPPGGGPPGPNVSEIVVTAQKRSERLLETPAPITALLSNTLNRDRSSGIADYAAKVPGLNFVSDQAGQMQVIMRGVSTGSVSSSTTGIYIDGAPFGSSTNYQLGGLTAPDPDPGSLERIEVLRGPQGTLYGASSLGGLLLFVSKTPSLTDYSGRVEADASAVDGGGQGYGLRAMVDGPIVAEKLGFTLSGFVRHDPGYLDNPLLGRKNVNDANVDGARAALLWRPSDDISVELSAVMHDSYSNAVSDEDLDANLRPIGGGLKVNRVSDTPFKIQDRLYIATVRDDFGWAKLTSITSYQTLRNVADSDYTNYFGSLLESIFSVSNLGVTLDSFEKRSKFTEELRLASPDRGRLEWQGGFFFTHEDSDNPQVLTAFNAPTLQPVDLGDLAHFNLMSRYTEYAVFGDATYHVTDRFSVLGGLRVSYNSQVFLETTSGLLAGGTNVAGGDSSDHSLTYLLAPKFEFDRDHMVYGRMASGYRPGGPNDVNAAQIALGAPPTYRPDSLTNYEVGYKAALLDRQLTVDLSAFDIEWRHIQMINVVNGLGFTGNGQTARSAGIEATETWTPRKGLTVTSNLAYTHAYLTGDVPTVGAKSGNELPYAARFAGSVGAEYDFALADGLGAFVGGNVHYLGDRTAAFVVGAPAGYRRPVMPAYATVDLHAGVSRGGLEVELYAKNLGDSHGINTINSLVLDGVSAPLAAAVIQPRTYGVSVTQKF